MWPYWRSCFTLVYMHTLDWYLIRSFTKNYLISVVALVALFLFQALLADLLERNYPGHQVLIYHLLDLPRILVQMTPPAVLLATIFTLSGMARSNELLACFSMGISLRRIVWVFLSLVVIISCVTLVMEDRILPLTFRKRTIYYWREMEKKPDVYLDIKKDKIWYRSKNLIYNLRLFDARTKTIIGMAIYTFDEDFNLMQVIEAERAEYTQESWHLRKGTVTVFSKDNQFPMTKQFDEKDIVIPETLKDFQEIEKQVDSLRLKELYRYIGRIKASGADTRAYEVKLHSKINLSFMPVLMCLLGVPFSLRRRREGGVARDIGLCVAFTFFYWIFYSVGLSLGNNGVLAPWLGAWLPSLIFAGLIMTLITRID